MKAGLIIAALMLLLSGCIVAPEGDDRGGHHGFFRHTAGYGR
jgi:starvation-inducible outer membrane lipoprotein